MSIRRPLTVERLRALLDRSQLRQKDLAWICGVSERQVRQWCAGTVTVPHYATLLLFAYDQKLLSDDWLIKQIAEPVT
jgi:DNA-binding transcriptional regulator YiaG